MPKGRSGYGFDVSEALTGYWGADVITGTSSTPVPTGYKWYLIQAIGTANATFTSLTGNVANGSSAVLPPGVSIGGKFTNLQLATGSVIAYRVPTEFYP